jgi:hypothetical protein
MILAITAIGTLVTGFVSGWYIATLDKDEKIAKLQEVIKRMREERKAYEEKYEAARASNAKAAAHYRMRMEKAEEVLKELRKELRDLKDE